ncbi:family 43 glycosylhydrolase [Bifidobacterium aesculapii]|uniref:family 43 glycosylhydrolase n=1 Tax=Bifidobacterium aesculapii TaxID=1329411 RepID=UPI0006E23407|nr:family 43 glycosylhydrolase [Bifidobacterium aesculapii]
MSSSLSPSLIVSGVPWFDDRGRTVNAHGGCIVEDDGVYYLFGEYKTDDENHFAGFSCYSSVNLVDWTFKRLVLQQQADGLMGPGRIGERVKVVKSPSTGKYVMYMHSDDLEYRDPHICYAVSDTIDGEYEFVGPVAYQGEPIYRWDLGVFQDDDGSAYLLVHEGDIYRMSDDRTFAEEKIADEIALGGEAPTIAKIDGRYYMLFSNKTSWDCNDNYCLSAPSMRGPWAYQGLFAPEGSMTCNSQSLFVLDIPTVRGIVPMFMGDRWSFPHQASAASYVWQPLSVDERGRLHIREYLPSWDPATGLGEPVPGERVSVGFRSNTVGDEIRIPFHGTCVALEGRADPWGSYAEVSVERRPGCDDGAVAGDVVVDPIFVSFYAKAPDTHYRYVSPTLPESDYVAVVRVTGEIPQWDDKTGQRFGSVDSYVDVSAAIVMP